MSLLGYGLSVLQLGGWKLVSKLDSLVIAATVDVKDLLGKDAAIQEGGQLEEANKKVQELGGGAFSIARNFVVYVFGIALLIAAAALALHGRNASKRDEDKSAIGWTIAAAVVGFGAVSILVFAQKIGEGLLG